MKPNFVPWQLYDSTEQQMMSSANTAKADWSMVSIGDVAKPVKRSEEPLPGTKYRQIGVRLWGMGAYERDILDGAETKYKAIYRVEKDDIIVNKIWARNGSVAVVLAELAGCYASGEFPIFAPDPQSLEPRWFHWITKTKFFWQQCDEKSHGTSGKNRIRPKRFLEIEIPLPPLEEQRRIVARIEELAAKVEAARALRQEAVKEVGNLVNSKARRILSTVEARITELRDWLDINRNGIQTGPFGSKLSSNDFIGNGIPVLTIGNVQYDGLDLSNLKHVSQEKAQELERYKIKEGDILFARMGTVGRCCVAPREVEGWLINYHIIRVALDKSQVEPRYIHWIIQSSADVSEYLDANIRGATRAGVNSKIVGSLPCRVPSFTQQRRIVAYLDALQAKVEAVKQHQAATAAALDALLPSILDRAFNGEL
jgi:type I restriction enzyme S subunit